MSFTDFVISCVALPSSLWAMDLPLEAFGLTSTFTLCAEMWRSLDRPFANMLQIN